MQRIGKAAKPRRIGFNPLVLLDAINATLEGLTGLFNPIEDIDDD
jgi:hypothetical protein